VKDARHSILENYSWTAFLRLKGQTWARRQEEILDEFDGFVQSLRSAGVDYNIIVKVKGKAPRQLDSDYHTRETAHKLARDASSA